jgi:hypothetical protein
MVATNPSATERRQDQRAPFRITAQLLLSGHQPFKGRTVDVSAKGASVVATFNLPTGLECTFRIRIPVKSFDSATFETRATVVQSVLSRSVGGFTIRLHFTDPAPEMVSAISNHVG